jgi:hypothetical protein
MARIISNGSAGIVKRVFEKNIVWMRVIDIAGSIRKRGILFGADFIKP